MAQRVGRYFLFYTGFCIFTKKHFILSTLNIESTTKSQKVRHCEARSNLISLIVNMLRLLLRQLADRNDEKSLLGAGSIFFFTIKRFNKYHNVQKKRHNNFSLFILQTLYMTQPHPKLTVTHFIAKMDFCFAKTFAFGGFKILGYFFEFPFI